MGHAVTNNSLENKVIHPFLQTKEASARHPDGDLIVVRIAQPEDVGALHALTIMEIGPSVAALETMRAVYKHNPETLWTIHRRPSEGGEDRLAGYFGFLHLNAAGLRALDERTLSGREPDLALLARAGERPVAIYVWAGIARKVRVLAELLVA